MDSKIKLPQMIITAFMLALFAFAGFLGMDIPELISGSFTKFVMNGVLVLAMIPMINAGVGMNFGLPVGIVAGLLGMCMAIQLRMTGIAGFLGAVALSVVPAVILGLIYAKVLNMVKGKEDIAAIFIGYSFIPIMNFVWTVIPFTNREMLYPVGAKGLRPKISLENYFGNVLNELMVLKLGKISVPLGLLFAYAVVCLLVYVFFKTKSGTVMLAVGENEKFCQLSGIRIDRVRTMAIVLSTVIGAAGICVYAQTYGFVELYNAPLSHSFPAVSAILIGGCIGRQAKISHAVLGTYLYQTIYLLSAPIANAILIPQMSEIVRMIITNGIILYAFLKQERRRRQ